MRILLLGMGGQLGFELQRSLSCLADILPVGRMECDLGRENAIRDLVRHSRPDLIVNAAAYTAVDRAETESELAHSINAVAPKILGEEAALLGAPVIHFSTDYVFDGTANGPYSEEDETAPVNVYGRTKRDGEIGLAGATDRHLIFRTSWVVGSHGQNFAKTILRLAAERDTLNVVSDQIGAPTSAALIADVVAHIVRRIQRDDTDRTPFGLYHLTADGAVSWHEYACFLVEEAARLGHPLRLQPSEIRAVTTSQYPTAANRPKNSLLNTSLFRQTFGLLLPDWKIGVQHILRQIL